MPELISLSREPSSLFRVRRFTASVPLTGSATPERTTGAPPLPERATPELETWIELVPPVTVALVVPVTEAFPPPAENPLPSADRFTLVVVILKVLVLVPT